METTVSTVVEVEVVVAECECEEDEKERDEGFVIGKRLKS